jgi:hypothetical protein
MRHRVFGVVVTTVLALTGMVHAQRQRKCDSKKEVEGAYIPPCSRNICPVLRAPNGTLHPNLQEIWAYPNDEGNFEVKRMTGNITRQGPDGCLRPRTGYEWVYPDDPRNFDVQPISESDSGAAGASTISAAASESVVVQGDCRPPERPGKHGTLNIYRVPFNGDGHGNGISQSIWVNFRMFDDGRIEAPLKYDNDSKEAFCGGVHIRLGDINNNSIAEFYSDPSQCVDGRPLISLGGGPIERTINWNLKTTGDVACKYAHLYIVPNHDHPATSPNSSPNPAPAIARVHLDPSDSINAGDDVRLVIDLDRAAPRGGLAVVIDSVTTAGLTDTLRTASGDPIIALTSFTFDEGVRSAPILIRTSRVTNQPTVVTFRVRGGNSQKSATLTVR